MRPTIEERFWGHVTKLGPDDCWEWNIKNRYGEIFVDGKLERAHRYSWKLHNMLIRLTHTAAKTY